MNALKGTYNARKGLVTNATNETYRGCTNYKGKGRYTDSKGRPYQIKGKGRGHNGNDQGRWNVMLMKTFCLSKPAKDNKLV
eukprot:5011475-Amphidinium_carterae.2